jgi:hypothetical protein
MSSHEAIHPPEVGDRFSAIREPPHWDPEILEAFWELLDARARLRGVPRIWTPEPVQLDVEPLAATPLQWVIGPGPRPHNNSRLTRTLYAPDNPKQGPQSDGKDVKAIKRMVSRSGFWKWQEFSTDYTDAFAHGATGPTGSGPGVDGLRDALGTGDGSGTFNERSYHALLYGKVPEGSPHAGEWICDATSENLLEDYQQAWDEDHKPPPPPKPVVPAGDTADQKKQKIRNAMSDYCRRSIASEPQIHYQQYRPMRALGKAPEPGFTADCSEHATCVYYWARKQTGIAVPDPNDSGYNGYGYTGTLIDNPRCSPNYLVGDLAIYGNSPSDTEHVVTCYQGGDADSSRWCSHGSEAAPYSVELYYRTDLVAVVRPPLLP